MPVAQCFTTRAPAARIAFSSRCPQRLAAKPVSRRCAVRVAAEIDPDNASILVCGGGGVALNVTRKLKDMGAWVWQLQRTDVRRKEIEGMMAIVAKGDALNAEEVERIMQSIDGLNVVISTLGGTTADPLVDSQGNINVMEAAAKAGVEKFVLVTSIGTGDSKEATPANVYEVLKPVLVEKEKAEQRLRELGDKMQFVIIRVGGLKSEPGTGKGVLTEDTTVCGSIHREDVADLVIRCLLSDKANGKTLSAVDAEQVFGSPVFETFKL